MRRPPLSSSASVWLILLLAAILRVATLGQYETWDDEKLSVSEARGMVDFNFSPASTFTHDDIDRHNTLDHVLESTLRGDGGNGILYTVMLHYWTEIFGASDGAARSLSVCAGLLVVLLVYQISLLFFQDKRLALLAMFFAAIHPYLITYAQETRSYSWGIVFSMLSVWVLFKMVHEQYYSTVRLLLYAATILASAFCHYSTIYVYACQLVFLMICQKPVAWKPLILVWGVACLGVLAWLYVYGFRGMEIIAERNAHYRALSEQFPDNLFYMKTSLYAFTGGWAQNLLTFMGCTLFNYGIRLIWLLPLLMIPLIAMFFFYRRFGQQYLNRQYSEATDIMMFVVLVPLLALLYASVLSVLSGHMISFQQNYAIFSMPFAIMFLSVIVGRTWKQSSLVRIGAWVNLIVVGMSVMLVFYGYDSHKKHPNRMDATMQLIRALIHEDAKAIIVSGTPEIAAELNRYLDDDRLSQVRQQVSPTPNADVYFVKADGSRVLVFRGPL